MSLLKKFLPLMMLVVLVAGSAGVVRAQEAASQESTKSEHVTSAPGAEKQVEVDENEAYKHSATVKKLGSMMGMGVDKAANVFEYVNFAILALALGWGISKILPKTFRDRTSAIQKHLVDARVATEQASLRLNSVEERLAKLDGQIADMRVQAEKDAAAEEQRMKSAVETETARILAAAEQEIASASLQAQRQLQKYAAELAIEQAGRKLVVSAETDRLLVQSFARRLAGDDSKGGQN